MRVGGFFGGSLLHPASLTSNFFFDFLLLASSLTHLSFGDVFNQPVDHLLPPHLTHLTFGKLFDQPVNFLPPKLTHLYFGKFYNHPLTSLPLTLTHLQLGHFFNHSLDFLPLALLEIKVESNNYYSVFFNLIITKLPPKLTTLHLRHQYRQNIDYLPESLTDLSICVFDTIKYPPNLKHFSFMVRKGEQISDLPNSLTTLSIREHNSSKPDSNKTAFANLPPKLQKLDLAGSFTFSIPLPSTLTHLSLRGVMVQKKIEEQFPQLTNLTHLIIFGKYVLPAEYLPPNLTHLESALIGDISPSHPLISLKGGPVNCLTLPTSLQQLITEASLNCELPLLEELTAPYPPSQFPSTLKKLRLTKYGDLSIQHDKIYLPPFPNSLEELYINTVPSHPLPPNLRVLHISTKNITSAFPLLPPSLVELQIGAPYISITKDFPLPALPPNLTKLTIYFTLQEKSLTNIPPSLKELKVFTNYTLPPLPLTLESLVINHRSIKDPSSIHDDQFFSHFSSLF